VSLPKLSDTDSFAGLRMRTVVQRCKNAEVRVQDESCGVVLAGLLLLIGFSMTPQVSAPSNDSLLALPQEAIQRLLEPLYQRWWDKVSQLRVFSDSAGKMNESILQQPAEYGFYLVSQFTLFADLRKGNRPSYGDALAAPVAKICFEHLLAFVRSRAAGRPLCSGIFGADMAVSFVNDGPVTLMFDCSSEGGVVAL
jgi:D-tyrosyl-tRNA(Tyr) deacylase